jgi:hypothetical protein
MRKKSSKVAEVYDGMVPRYDAYARVTFLPLLTKNIAIEFDFVRTVFDFGCSSGLFRRFLREAQSP